MVLFFQILSLPSHMDTREKMNTKLKGKDKHGRPIKGTINSVPKIFIQTFKLRHPAHFAHCNSKKWHNVELPICRLDMDSKKLQQMADVLFDIYSGDSRPLQEVKDKSDTSCAWKDLTSRGRCSWKDLSAEEKLRFELYGFNMRVSILSNIESFTHVSINDGSTF